MPRRPGEVGYLDRRSGELLWGPPGLQYPQYQELKTIPGEGEPGMQEQPFDLGKLAPVARYGGPFTPLGPTLGGLAGEGVAQAAEGTLNLPNLAAALAGPAAGRLAIAGSYGLGKLGRATGLLDRRLFTPTTEGGLVPNQAMKREAEVVQALKAFIPEGRSFPLDRLTPAALGGGAGFYATRDPLQAVLAGLLTGYAPYAYRGTRGLLRAGRGAPLAEAALSDLMRAAPER